MTLRTAVESLADEWNRDATDIQRAAPPSGIGKEVAFAKSKMLQKHARRLLELIQQHKGST